MKVMQRIGKFTSYLYWKIIVLMILLTALSFSYSHEPLVVDAYILERGWPLLYWGYMIGTFPLPPNMPPPTGHTYFVWPNLVVDFFLAPCFLFDHMVL